MLQNVVSSGWAVSSLDGFLGHYNPNFAGVSVAFGLENGYPAQRVQDQHFPRAVREETEYPALGMTEGKLSHAG